MNHVRQIRHILLKDIRGHALEIGIVLLLNVVLAQTLTLPWTESLSWSERPDPGKTLIGIAAQLLLVLAWCALIGRVVQDDGVAGKSPYWLTRPFSRPVLLASKLAFVLLFVHLPIFLSHLVIVTGSGLPLSLAQMLADQVVFAVVVSLPVMALATLTTSFTRFVFVGVAIAAVVLFVAVEASTRNPFYAVGSIGYIASNFFVAAGLALLAATAGVALICQYRWRATLRVAISALVALSLLGLGTLTLPTLLMMRMRAAVFPPQTVAPTILLRDASARRIYEPWDITNPPVISLPIEMTIADDAAINYTEVDVRSAAGRDVEPLGGLIRRTSGGDTWLDLRLSQSNYNSLKDNLGSVRLIVEIETYETRETEPIPNDGSFAIIGGRAQCGIPDAGAPFTCRTSSGWSTWAVDSVREAAWVAMYQLSLPVRLRFAINPIVTQTSGSSEVLTSVRRRVSYTRQDVTFENIRLGDWGP